MRAFLAANASCIVSDDGGNGSKKKEAQFDYVTFCGRAFETSARLAEEAKEAAKEQMMQTQRGVVDSRTYKVIRYS